MTSEELREFCIKRIEANIANATAKNAPAPSNETTPVSEETPTSDETPITEENLNEIPSDFTDGADDSPEM